MIMAQGRTSFLKTCDYVCLNKKSEKVQCIDFDDSVKPQPGLGDLTVFIDGIVYYISDRILYSFDVETLKAPQKLATGINTRFLRGSGDVLAFIDSERGPCIFSLKSKRCHAIPLKSGI